MARPPLKLIEWEDAYNGDHEWIDVDDIALEAEPFVVTTGGFEVRRDKKHVVLAMSYGDSRATATCCDLFTIPLGMIRSEKTLKA